jgi:hypothetical protein
MAGDMAGSLGKPILAVSAPVLSCAVQVRTSTRTYSTRNELSRIILNLADASRLKMQNGMKSEPIGEPLPWTRAPIFAHGNITHKYPSQEESHFFAPRRFFVAQIAFLVAQPRLAVHSAAPSGTGVPRTRRPCVYCVWGWGARNPSALFAASAPSCSL